MSNARTYPHIRIPTDEQFHVLAAVIEGISTQAQRLQTQMLQAMILEFSPSILGLTKIQTFEL